MARCRCGPTIICVPWPQHTSPSRLTKWGIRSPVVTALEECACPGARRRGRHGSDVRRRLDHPVPGCQSIDGGLGDIFGCAGHSPCARSRWCDCVSITVGVDSDPYLLGVVTRLKVGLRRDTRADARCQGKQCRPEQNHRSSWLRGHR